MVAAAMSVAAQVVWTEPELVQQSTEGIYVYFDASKGNAGLKGYTGDVYAHTGVTTAAGLWQHAPTWGDNSAKYKLEKVNGDVWRLAIGNLKSYYGLKDGEAVTQMCFVFRSGDKSKEGKDAGGKDIFVDVQPNRQRQRQYAHRRHLQQHNHCHHLASSRYQAVSRFG